MRNGQNKRMRGRNRKNQNPLSRVYESNGPDVKIRGSASHIAEKYVQLARDAQSSGDPVSAENYYQHAEHYYRLIAAAQEQFRQHNPQFYRPEHDQRADARDDFDDGDDEGTGNQPQIGGPGEAPFGTREPQPYIPRDAQPFPAIQQPQHHVPRQQAENQGDVDRLPSFITGGQQHQQQQQNFGGNGHDNQPDRFPLHRRRRRHHRGPRQDFQGGPPQTPGDDEPRQG
jgi:hypothetical protein